MNDENISALPAGTILNGQYEIKSLLGMGGFGITYRGFDRFLEVDVAIKEFFLPALVTRNVQSGNMNVVYKNTVAEKIYGDEIKKFELEANRISKLNGLPGIIKVYNFFLENSTAYMVMDFVEGTTLKKYRYDRGGKLPWEEITGTLHPIITSLATVHEAGIIHRDISPDNIMLGEDGQVTLIDFGAARYSDNNQNKTVVLKKNFAPPEQYQKDGMQGPWSDVYAMCATLYLLITGVIVPDAMSRLDGIYELKPISEYVPDIPKYVNDVIMQGLELDISDRISSMSELEKGLYTETKVQKKFMERTPTRVAFCGMVTGIMLLLIGVLLINAEGIKERINRKTEIASITDEKRDEEVNITDESLDLTENNRDTDIYDDEKSTVSTSYQAEAIPELFANCVRPETRMIVYSALSADIADISEVNADSVNFIVPSVVDNISVRTLKYTNINAVKVYIENGIEVIANGAFSGCMYLEYVYIPGSVTEIASNAFSNCISLKGITVSENNEHFYIKENVLYDLEGNALAEWN